MYYLLHGFTSAPLLGALAACHAPVSAIVRFQAEEVPLPPGTDFKSPWVALHHAAQQAPSGAAVGSGMSYLLCPGSPVRDIAWLDVPIGPSGVAPDPALIYDAAAALIYEALNREDKLNSYNEGMRLFKMPSLSLDQPDTAIYRKCGAAVARMPLIDTAGL